MQLWDSNPRMLKLFEHGGARRGLLIMHRGTRVIATVLQRDNLTHRLLLIDSVSCGLLAFSLPWRKPKG
jgi:hypothetical protein